jgi:uncharacterized protein with HEPN domain
MDKAGKYLFDIRSAIALIELFLKDTDSFDAYRNDPKTQSAVERQLAIIGEVANKLKQENTNYALVNTRQMIDFRNRLLHSYDHIDHSIVWVILKKHLPVLKQEIENLIESQ